MKGASQEDNGAHYTFTRKYINFTYPLYDTDILRDKTLAGHITFAEGISGIKRILVKIIMAL